jgi:hypothetical protein
MQHLLHHGNAHAPIGWFPVKQNHVLETTMFLGLFKRRIDWRHGLFTEVLVFIYCLLLGAGCNADYTASKENVIDE